MKIHEHDLNQGEWFEATRVTVALVALTVAGAAAYLAYRRQRTADENQRTAAQTQLITANAYQLSVEQYSEGLQRELRKRFTDAVLQLSHSMATVRIAGAFSLAALVDEWTAQGNRVDAQVCIEVLCGYLRLPYSPVHGNSDSVKRTVTSPRLNPDGTVGAGDVTEHYEFRQNDRISRLTILRMIAEHLRNVGDSGESWSCYGFDFRSATLEDVNFEDCTFGAVSFAGTRFVGDANFQGVKFKEAVSFAGAHFESNCSFDGAQFDNECEFTNARFFGTWARFVSCNFGGEFSFEETFASMVVFSACTFKVDASFEFSQFTRSVLFSVDTVFHGMANFIGCKFGKFSVGGRSAVRDKLFRTSKTESKFIDGGPVKFMSECYFLGAIFEDEAVFQGTVFEGKVHFERMGYAGRRSLGTSSVEFRGGANFSNATFNQGAIFTGVNFGDKPVVLRNINSPLPLAFDWSEAPDLKPDAVVL
ncbi:pentapeptide repeat-containing protein [Nocardia sp. NPDC057668]|uniref:pentapeptide repeat-containing protein n=1 Tax=Nocardia sp. NPDC057668 TaxID=3346202 RepID=UPI00366E3BEF